MCGRYFVSIDEDIIAEVNRRYCGTPALLSMKTGEVRPTDTAPVLVCENGIVRPALMRWGFPLQKGGVIINARSETAADKKMFRASLLHRRCAVPATGFFEWRHEGGKTKEKYLFRIAGERMLYLAGFYDACLPPGEAPYTGYVILTAAANPTIADYHDRMPLLLREDQLQSWFTDTAFALNFLRMPCTGQLTATKA
jgi:putative SOS response-associated peptidase YedK